MDADKNPLAHKSYKEIRGMMGTILGSDAGEDFQAPTITNAAASDSYDARDAVPSCVHAIRDQ
jgi:hypothetical protein